MNLLCRLVGHHFEKRVTGKEMLYVGEICTRCAHPVPDHLTPAPKDTRGYIAVINRPDAPTLYVAVTQLDMSLDSPGRSAGLEISLRGYAL